MSNDANARVAWDFLIGHGLSPEQAAGILGNGSQESGFEIDSEAPSTGAYGIFQWLGARKEALFNATGDGGDLNAQLEFFWNEIENNPYESAQFEQFLNYPDQSVEGYTYAFRKFCERPSEGEAMDTNRIDEANRYLSLFSGDSQPETQQPEDDGYSYTDLDMSHITSNHPEDPERTRLTGFQPQTIHGLNKIADYMYNTYDVPLVITGGTESGPHSPGTYSHENGWKADIDVHNMTPNNEAG